MNIKKIIYFLLAFILLGCQQTPSNQQTTFIPQYDGRYGTAGYIKDKTLIISIFTDDMNSKWNEQNQEDINMKNQTLQYLITACQWISEQVKAYNCQSQFIYDWKTNPDLLYQTHFDEELVRYDISQYDNQCQYIKNTINSDELKKKYQAENVIYIFFFNTDYSNEVNPWSLKYESTNHVDIEIINMFAKFDAIMAPPATYAHELLHCFGAYDYYYENSCIPQTYVDYQLKSHSNDIMYIVNDENFITNEFSALDAYYIGLIDQCDEVDQWNLGKSDYLNQNASR